MQTRHATGSVCHGLQNRVVLAMTRSAGNDVMKGEPSVNRTILLFHIVVRSSSSMRKPQRGSYPASVLVHLRHDLGHIGVMNHNLS